MWHVAMLVTREKVQFQNLLCVLLPSLLIVYNWMSVVQSWALSNLKYWVYLSIVLKLYQTFLQMQTEQFLLFALGIGEPAVGSGAIL